MTGTALVTSRKLAAGVVTPAANDAFVDALAEGVARLNADNSGDQQPGSRYVSNPELGPIVWTGKGYRDSASYQDPAYANLEPKRLLQASLGALGTMSVAALFFAALYAGDFVKTRKPDISGGATGTGEIKVKAMTIKAETTRYIPR